MVCVTFCLDYVTSEAIQRGGIQSRELRANDALELLRDEFVSWIGVGFKQYADAFEDRFRVQIPLESASRPMFWPPGRGTSVLHIRTDLERWAFQLYEF